MHPIRNLAGAALLLGAALVRLNAAEVIPPKPDRYFNDYDGVVSKEAAYRFNEQLARFERETSDQVVVAVFPKMQSDSDIADYTQRVAQAWGVGQKERRNGVALFVFIQERKMFIQVGYGLEGALPDATAFDNRRKRVFSSNGIAGTVTSLAAMALQLATYDPARVHGFNLSLEALIAEIARLSAATQAERERFVGLDPRRADVILAGAVILCSIAMATHAAAIRVSDRGIRWGLLHEALESIS